MNVRLASSRPATTLVGVSLADVVSRALSAWQARVWVTGHVVVGDASRIACSGWESVWWIHDVVL